MSRRLRRGADLGTSSPSHGLSDPSSPPPPLSSTPDRAMGSGSEDDGEDLHGQHMEMDYRPKPEEDTYDVAELDERDYDELDFETRRAAETEMAKRDAKRSRMPAALLEEDDEEADTKRARRQRRLAEEALGEAPEEELEEVPNLEDFKGQLREWISLNSVRKEIARRYTQFLRTYTDKQGVAVYAERLKEMCIANKQSLEVSFLHLTELKETSVVGVWTADAPTEMLEILDEVTFELVLKMFPSYRDIHSEVHVRITDLPIGDSLRELRQVHLNALVRVSGVVTRRTGVFPQLKRVKFDCVKCGTTLGPFNQSTYEEVKVGSCPECQSKGPFNLNMEQTIYGNYQKITLQESPGTVPPGRVPRSKEVILLGDLIDIARPGEEIDVTGIYLNNFDASLNTKNGFPVFATVIEANHVTKPEDLMASVKLTDDDRKEIQQLSKDPKIADRIIASIAPSIFGHNHIKTSLALSMFGGQPKDIDGKHRIRGDINVLLLGDPGMAKSQFLKYVEKTSPRAVYATGQGASAVGLTASVQRDAITREWTLEGGALVLADKGVCLIDEFDKMNDQDRTSIHEAMEQQSISISKAGIVTTLQARCAVMAAANPVRGRYDSSLTFAQNVDLTEPILSRFDCLCVIKDTVDPIMDEKLARFVVESHGRATERANGNEVPSGPIEASEGSNSAEPLSQDLLRKYIVYAKQSVSPKLHNIDQDKIANLYSELRRESMNGGGVPIAVRHIESIIRMSEAHARMHLRDHVREDDVNMAIRVALESFISSQKFSVSRALQKRFQRYITHNQDSNELLLYILQTCVRDAVYYESVRKGTHEDDFDNIDVDCEEFESKARDLNIHEKSVEQFYRSGLFKSNKFALDKKRKVVTKAFRTPVV